MNQQKQPNFGTNFTETLLRKVGIILYYSLALEKFEKCSRFHILYAYIAHDKLDNRYKSLYELMLAEDNKPELREEMSIFIFK